MAQSVKCQGMKQHLPSSHDDRLVVSNNVGVCSSNRVESDETCKKNKTCGQYTKTEKLQIVFIDWDDTLCPTHAVFKIKGNNANVEELHHLGQYIYQLLSSYIQLFGANNVYIVTNGSNNWVQQSLISLSNLCKQLSSKQDYFALIYNVFLCKYRMTVISAQHFYYQYHHQQGVTESEQTMKWKLFTFKSIVHNYLKEKKSKITSFCILSIGDSMDEYNASYYTKQWMQQQFGINNVSLHRIKLSKKPSIDYLMNECRFLISLIPIFQSKIDYLTKHELNIDYQQERLSRAIR